MVCPSSQPSLLDRAKLSRNPYEKRADCSAQQSPKSRETVALTRVPSRQLIAILRLRGCRLRRFVILQSNWSGRAFIRIGYSSRRREDRFLDRLTLLFISTFSPWFRPPNALIGRILTLTHKAPLCDSLILSAPEDKFGARPSDVGERLSD